MSDAGPNNPYGPPQDRSGGYGRPPYPQQPGEGYGGTPYPQQPGRPYGAYPGGGPPVPQEMPGTVKAARVLLFVFGGLGALGALMVTAMGALLNNKDVREAVEEQGGLADGVTAGLLITLGLLSLILSVAEIVVGAKFGKGGSGIRIAAIVVGALMAVAGVFYFPFGLLWIVVGALVVVFSAMNGAAWFDRPRY